MPSGNGFMREVLERVIDDARRNKNARFDAEYIDGFNEAANICLSVLSESIDGLLAKIESGDYLSNQEQFLLARLKGLETEMQTGFKNSFASGLADGADRDQRPIEA
jgi:hypothetical protein